MGDHGRPRERRPKPHDRDPAGGKRNGRPQEATGTEAKAARQTPILFNKARTPKSKLYFGEIPFVTNPIH